MWQRPMCGCLTALRRGVCSGVPGCLSDLWTFGALVALPDSGHVPWGCCKPVRGSLPRRAEDSDPGAFCAEQRGPWTPGGAVPRGAGPGLWDGWRCGEAASPRCAPGRRAGTLAFTSPPWLFFSSPPSTRSSFPSPHQADGGLGCGERGGGRVRARFRGGFRRVDYRRLCRAISTGPPFPLPLPFPYPSDPTVLLFPAPSFLPSFTYHDLWYQPSLHGSW